MQRFLGKMLPSSLEPRQDRQASWRSPLRDRDFLAHSLPEAAALCRSWSSAGSLLVIKVDPPAPRELLHAPSLSGTGPRSRAIARLCLGHGGSPLSHELRILCDSVEQF